MNTKIHILLDSSIYRHDPKRNTLEFKAITALCKSKNVQLHIPFIVENEFCSHQLIEQKKAIEKCITSIAKLPSLGLHTELIDSARRIKKDIESLLDGISNKGTDFNNWAESIGAKRYPLNLTQAKGALQAYFDGTAPLKAPKVRKDIPDAFIYQCISEIIEDIPNLIVVVADNNFREALSTKLNLKCYINLTEFIKEEDIQIILREHKFIDNFPDCLVELNDYLSSNTEEAVGDSIINNGIESLSDESDATIHRYGDMETIEFTFEKAVYYGDGLVGVPFVAIIEAYYSYYIFKADYCCMENPPSSISDHNKHYFEANDSNFVRVEGILEFSLEYESYEKENMSKLINNISVNEVSSIDLYNPEYLMVIVEKDGFPFPVANISRKNFVKYELPKDNTMRIHHRQKNQETNAWSIKTITFEIDPLNKHMLRVREW